jgi:beta-galactosidase GanA
MRTRPLAIVGLCFPLLAACGAPKYPGAPERPLPSIVHEDGRHALFVDGAFLMLGAQVNNSSAWPAVLPKVWPAIEYLHANTVEMPIYWEQFEPEPRRFDTSVLDTLLAEARRHEVRLVLLWFGTWKNGSAHYLPEWAKRSPERFPCMLDEHRRPVDSPSPFAAAALEADARAFTALMAHLRDVDRERTVLMVQVENEPGTWGCVRDFSPEAERRFAAPPPAELLTALHKEPAASWRAAFGDDADEFFHAWSVASYVGRVAAAGKRCTRCRSTPTPRCVIRSSRAALQSTRAAVPPTT